MTKKEVSEMEDIYNCDCNHDCANCPLVCGHDDDKKDDDDDDEEDDNE